MALTQRREVVTLTTGPPCQGRALQGAIRAAHPLTDPPEGRFVPALDLRLKCG
jgi:hypothetical protein